MNIRTATSEFYRTRPLNDKYALGYTKAEFKRLEMQADFIRDLTKDVLIRSGLQPGMRVLDLGCGIGDVSMLAGEIVGSSGAVLGVDRSPESTEVAARRVVEAGQCYWVRFANGDLATIEPDGTFDAIIGRFILMYLPDPAGTLRRLRRFLKPGGIIAFHEMAMHTARSVPFLPLFDSTVSRIIETFECTGFHTDMAGRLYGTYLAAGLPAPQMISAARTEGGAQSYAYDYMAATTRSLLPLMEKTGVATATDVGIDDLAERLRAEAVARGACLFMPTLTGAWTRLPA